MDTVADALEPEASGSAVGVQGDWVRARVNPENGS